MEVEIDIKESVARMKLDIIDCIVHELTVHDIDDLSFQRITLFNDMTTYLHVGPRRLPATNQENKENNVRKFRSRKSVYCIGLCKAINI